MLSFIKEKATPIGLLLSVISIIFIAINYQHNFVQILIFVTDHYILITLLALAYALSNYLLAYSYNNFMQIFEVASNYHLSNQLTANFQMTKYIPGNVTNFFTRHLLGKSAGLSDNVLIRLSVIELLCLIGTAALLAGLLFLSGYLLLVVIMATFFSVVFRRKLNNKHYLVLSSVIAYILFFTISTFIFIMVLSTVNSNVNVIDYPLVANAYIASWLAGIIVPGAPAGLGVREIFLLKLMPTHIGESESFVAITATRLVMIFGDIIFFIKSLVFRKVGA